MVLLVTILLSITAISAADTDDSTANLPTDYAVNSQTESNTNIESNSIKNTVSNEYETNTNNISSNNNPTDTQTVNKQNVIIKTNPITAFANQEVTINANVTYPNGEILSSAKTAIKINGKTIGQPRVTNGTISFNYEIPKWHAKDYNITILVGETTNTATTSIDTLLSIQRHNVTIDFSDYNVSSAAKTTFNAKVNYENGTAANGTKAVFKINGKTISSTTVVNGVASVTYVVPTKATTYDMVLKIGESTVSFYNDTTVKLTVNKRTPTVKIDSLIFAQSNKTVRLKAQLTDVGYANASGKIGFKVNGKTVATVRMVNSTAEYYYDVSKLKQGNHVVSVVYGGSSALYEVRKNTTLRVQSQFVSSYTYKEVLEKAVSVSDFIVKNKRLPNYSLMSGNEVSMADLLYMLTQVVSYNNSFHNGGFSEPSSNTKTSQYGGSITSDDYVSLAKTIVNSYINTGSAPKTIKSASGLTLSFSDAVFTYAKTVAFIANNNRLPNYVTITNMASSSSSTSSSSTTTSINITYSGWATNNIVPAGYEQYVAGAKNAYVNSTILYNAVKTAIAGKTSIYSQAVAIFDYVNNKTDYSSYLNTRYGAIGTYIRGYGNCVDQSHLLLGMYRTARIPARYCHATCYFNSGLVIGHVWVEVYVGGTWYKCDTTSMRNSFNVINNWYKSSTVTRYTVLPF